MTNIYALIDPTTKFVRYVGKSDNPEHRLHRHMTQDIKADNHRTRWLRKLKENGLKPDLVILEEVPKSEWQIHEKKWIKYYKESGYPLTNSTDGGDGMSNPSKETRLKISMNSRTRTAETLAKIGAATKKRWEDRSYRCHMVDCASNTSTETRKKMSEAAKSRPPEIRAKQAEAIRGRRHTKEHKRKISEGGKLSFTAERRAAISKRNREATISESTKRKHSEYKKTYWDKLRGFALTETMINEILSLKNIKSQKDIGEIYSISQSAVSRIMRTKTNQALTTQEFD